MSLAGSAAQLQKWCAREVRFGDKRNRATTTEIFLADEFCVRRGQHDPGMPRERREFACELDAVAIGQLDVDQERVWSEPLRIRERDRNRARLADHGQAAGSQQPPRQLPEMRVVVDDQN